MFEFPPNPASGDTIIADNGAAYIWDGEKWGAHTAPQTHPYLPLSGGQLSGPLTVDAPSPPGEAHLVVLGPAEIDGPLTLTVPPVNPSDAVDKAYVDGTIVQPATTPPLMNGTAAIGTNPSFARADHVHGSDTSRYAATNPASYINITQARTGTTTNDNPAAGQIGEFLSVQRLSTNALALTTNADAVLTTLSLTQGDWDVWGSVGFTLTNNNTTILRAWLNAGGTTAPSIDQLGGNMVLPVGNNITQVSLPLPPMRVSIAATTGVALGVTVVFTGTITGWGKIMARRRR
jgi:hypothetical protein